MTVQELKETIIEIISETVDADIEITEETNLVEDVGLASMEVMVMLGDMEEALGIDIPISRIKNVETVEDLIQVLIKLLTE